MRLLRLLTSAWHLIDLLECRLFGVVAPLVLTVYNSESALCTVDGFNSEAAIHSAE
jgi:hypothetical protein